MRLGRTTRLCEDILRKLLNDEATRQILLNQIVNKKTGISAETYALFDELVRLANIGVRKAQEESRRNGVPNVYSINGRIYYETPSGELSLTDPYVEPDKKTE